MRVYQIVDVDGEVADTYKDLVLAKEFRRIRNINNPGHTLKVFPTPLDKPLEVGDEYMDRSGCRVKIKKINLPDNTLYAEDIDEKYGDWKGEGAIFWLDGF